MNKFIIITVVVSIAASPLSPAQASDLPNGLYGWTHDPDGKGNIDLVSISESNGQATFLFSLPMPSGYKALDLTYDPTNCHFYGNLRDNAGNVRFADIDPVAQTMNSNPYTGDPLVGGLVEGIEYSKNEDLRDPGKGIIISGGNHLYRVTQGGVVSNHTDLDPPIWDQDSLGANSLGGALHVFDSNNAAQNGGVIMKWDDPPGPFGVNPTVTQVYNGAVLTGNERDLAVDPCTNRFYSTDLSRLVRFNMVSQQEEIVGNYNYPGGDIWGIAVANCSTPPCLSPSLYGALTNGTLPNGDESYTFAQVSTMTGNVTPLFDFTLPYPIGGMAFDPESGKFVVTVPGPLQAGGQIVEIDAVTQTVGTPQTVTGLPPNETYVQAIEYDPNEPVGQRMVISFGPDGTNGNDRFAAVDPATGSVSVFTGHTPYDLDGLAYSPATSEFITADTNNVPFRIVLDVFPTPSFGTPWASPSSNAEYWEAACSDDGKMYFSKRDTLDLWYIERGSSSYVRVGSHVGTTPITFAHGLAFGTIPECVPAPANMVAWWPLNELAGGTATDIVGGHTGTHVNGPVPLAGQYVDNALCFNGTNSYVNVVDAPALNFGTGDFSIDAWVKTTQMAGVRIIVDKRLESGTTTGYSFFLNTPDSRLACQLADGVGFTNYVSGTVIANGVWRHVALTVDRDSPTGGKFYVDGVNVSTFNPTARSGSLTNTNPLRIGSRSSSVSAVFNGCIDEVELFDRVLDPCEVASIFCAHQAGKCRCRCLADVNGDGILNGTDISAFIRCLLNLATPADNCLCADLNGDGSKDAVDIPLFVSNLLTKQPCSP